MYATIVIPYLICNVCACVIYDHSYASLSFRYIVIDMTAGPVQYGKIAGSGEGAVGYESFPRIIE